MTTSVYWVEVEHGEPEATYAYWVELEHHNAPTHVYWVEVEATSEIGESVTGSADLPEIYAITLTGAGTTTVGGTIDMAMQVTDQDGDPIANVLLAPASDDTGIATVTQLSATDTNGEATVRATGVAGGVAEVSVVGDGLVTAIEQTITVLEVTTVNLSIPATSLEVGTTGIATATALDQNDDPVAGVTITWASTTDATIADPASSVTGSDGRVSVPLPALAAGTTTITATCEGVNSAGIVVTVTAVASAPGYSATGSAKVVINCVSVIKRMGRGRPRRFSDADQRKLDPTDTAFSRVVDQQEKELVWPSAALMRRFM